MSDYVTEFVKQPEDVEPVADHTPDEPERMDPGANPADRATAVDEDGQEVELDEVVNPDALATDKTPEEVEEEYQAMLRAQDNGYTATAPEEDDGLETKLG